jgi:hypothetical protein
MTGILAQCIHCGQAFDPSEGEGDHTLSARLFGEFEDDRTFRGDCPACNNDFGRFDQLLAQSSQLGFYRRVVRPNLGRRKYRGTIHQRGSHGGKAPVFTLTHEGRSLLVEPCGDDPFDAACVDQIDLEDADGNNHLIRLFPEMTERGLQKELDRRGIVGMKNLRLDCDEELREQYMLLLGKVWPMARMVEEGATEKGVHRVPGRVEFQFSSEYFQALTKMAFHYYLTWCRRGYKGSESIFDEVRAFIKHGGEHARFFRSSGRRFAVPFGHKTSEGIAYPKNWCHLFAADETRNEIVVYMQLFAGPGFIPRPTYFTLGRIASDLVVPVSTGVWGHVFEYEANRTVRYAGRMHCALVSLLGVN